MGDADGGDEGVTSSIAGVGTAVPDMEKFDQNNESDFID